MSPTAVTPAPGIQGFSASTRIQSTVGGEHVMRRAGVGALKAGSSVVVGGWDADCIVASTQKKDRQEPHRAGDPKDTSPWRHGHDLRNHPTIGVEPSPQLMRHTRICSFHVDGEEVPRPQTVRSAVDREHLRRHS